MLRIDLSKVYNVQLEQYGSECERESLTQKMSNHW